MKINCLYDQLVKTTELKQNPKNPNQHSPDQLKRLGKILEYQGWRYPIKVSKLSGFITAGHGRLAAAIALGWDEVPVNYQAYENEAQEYADLVSDNAIAEWALLDLTLIKDGVGEFGPDFDLELLGLKDFDFSPAIIAGCDEDEAPEIKQGEALSKPGDLWILGEHRVLCGDSTNVQHVERLMNGEKADMVFTDPPYGVSYAEKNKWLNSLGTGHRLTKAIENDSQTPEQMNEFWFTVLSNIHIATTDKCSYYICSPQGGDLMMMMMMSIIRAGWQLKHILIWVKNNHVLGRCDYNYKHEPIIYGWKDGGTHEFIGGGRCKTSVWDFNRPLKNDLHPTMKPVELCEEAILNSSNNSGKVIDLFLGSGSTLIACEKTNRKCFGMEIDPHYTDVICKRFIKYSGKRVYRIDETGQEIDFHKEKESEPTPA